MKVFISIPNEKKSNASKHIAKFKEDCKAACKPLFGMPESLHRIKLNELSSYKMYFIVIIESKSTETFVIRMNANSSLKKMLKYSTYKKNLLLK